MDTLSKYILNKSHNNTLYASVGVSRKTFPLGFLPLLHLRRCSSSYFVIENQAVPHACLDKHHRIGPCPSCCRYNLYAKNQ